MSIDVQISRNDQAAPDDPRYILTVEEFPLGVDLNRVCCAVSRTGFPAAKHLGPEGWQAELAWLTPEQFWYVDHRLKFLLHFPDITGLEGRHFFLRFRLPEFRDELQAVAYWPLELETEPVPPPTRPARSTGRLSAFPLKWGAVAAIASLMLVIVGVNLRFDAEPVQTVMAPASTTDDEPRTDVDPAWKAAAAGRESVLESTAPATGDEGLDPQPVLAQLIKKQTPKTVDFLISPAAVPKPGAATDHASMTEVSPQPDAVVSSPRPGVPEPQAEPMIPSAPDGQAPAAVAALSPSPASNQPENRAPLPVVELMTRASDALAALQPLRSIHWCDQAAPRNADAAMICARWFDPAQEAKRPENRFPHKAFEYYLLAEQQGRVVEPQLQLLFTWLQNQGEQQHLASAIRRELDTP